MSTEDVDLVVIGTGQGGKPLAGDRAKAGQRVVIFERAEVGGTCVNTGCTPSKTFLASAHAAARARQAARLGVETDVRVDFGAVMRRVRAVRDRWRDGARSGLEESGARLVRAEARFVDRRTVEGGGVRVRGERVVIDTGTHPVVPDIPGMKGTPVLTTDTFFDLEELPRRTGVLGAGFVGVELGQGLARLGSEVSIVDRHEHVLHKEDRDGAQALQEALRGDGITLHLGVEVERVRFDGGTYGLELSDGASVACDALLVAAGRAPNTEALDLPAGGIEADQRGRVRVNDRLETTCPGVFAIGEVAGQPPFTHVAYEDYRRLLDIFDGGERTRSDRVLAYCAFTEPQVARAGLSAGEARRAGREVREVSMALSSIARAAEWGHEHGLFRLVVEPSDGRILGATLVGYEAGELVHTVVCAMEAGMSWHDLARVVGVHPTYGEGLITLVRKLEG